MVVLLFIVEHDRESQMAYKELMMSRMKFKPFIIRGKNVSERLKREFQITQVPTLLFQKRKKVEGYRNIKILIESIEQKIQNSLRPRDRRVRQPPVEQEDISDESEEEPQSAQEESEEEFEPLEEPESEEEEIEI